MRLQVQSTDSETVDGSALLIRPMHALGGCVLLCMLRMRQRIKRNLYLSLSISRGKTNVGKAAAD